MNLRTLQEAGDLRGKRVFVRVDFNLSIVDQKVADDFRITATLPTIEYLQKAGAKIILATHLENKDGGSLELVSQALKKKVPHVYIASTDFVVIDEHIEGMAEGEVTLLTNLRFWRGEEMADEHFALDMSRLADVYVNDAFAVSHRNHASITLLPKLLPSFAGLRLLLEIENLSRVFHPEKPFVFILAGAKFETKGPLIKKFLPLVTNIFIGGALANDIFKARGLSVGRSLVSEKAGIIPQDIVLNDKVLVPLDVTVETEPRVYEVKKPEAVGENDRVVDAGPQTVEYLRKITDSAKLILWNGPLGIYEEGVVKQTEELALTIAESSGLSIVGGGDTIAAIKRLQLESSFTFLSTGGGAMLEFLEKETLPGIEVLKKEEAPN